MYTSEGGKTLTTTLEIEADDTALTGFGRSFCHLCGNIDCPIHRQRLILG